MGRKDTDAGRKQGDDRGARPCRNAAHRIARRCLQYSGGMIIDRRPRSRIRGASALDPVPRQAFVPFDGVLYLDCAAQAPRLRAVLAAGHAALEAGATPWTLSFERLEAQHRSLARRVARSAVRWRRAMAWRWCRRRPTALATAARNLELDCRRRRAGARRPVPVQPAAVAAALRGDRRAPGGRATRRRTGLDRGDARRRSTREPRVRIVAAAAGALGRWRAARPRPHRAARARRRRRAGAGPEPEPRRAAGGPRALAARISWCRSATSGCSDRSGWPGCGRRRAGASRAIAIEQHWSARDAGDDWRFPIDDRAALSPRRAPFRCRRRRRSGAAGDGDGRRSRRCRPGAWRAFADALGELHCAHSTTRWTRTAWSHGKRRAMRRISPRCAPPAATAGSTRSSTRCGASASSARAARPAADRAAPACRCGGHAARGRHCRAGRANRLMARL